MNTLLNHPERVAIARLHALLELLPTALDKRLRPAGITSFEYTLLETLAEADNQVMRMSAVAQKTNATLPRISRVVTSLERRDLIGRAPCAEDARATNLVLTENGANTYAHSRSLYAEAVRDLVLDGVETLPGDGTGQLADLSYAILSSLDPDRAARDEEAAGCAADPGAGASDTACAADPADLAGAADAAAHRPELECAADPAPEQECAADPVPEQECAADPMPEQECAADPAPERQADPASEQDGAPDSAPERRADTLPVDVPA